MTENHTKLIAEYEDRLRQAKDLLLAIDQAIDIDTFDRAKMNWGHLGSMEHVLSKLREIGAFLNVGDTAEY